MNRGVVVLVGILPALLVASCAKDPPESDTEPAASAEKRKLSTKAKGRLDCDVAWPIFEQDDKLTRAFGGRPHTLEQTKPRTKAIDELVTEWAAASSKVQSDRLRKHGKAVIALLEQRRALYQTAIERAERGDPVPAPPKDETKAEQKPKRPLTEREKMLQMAAEEGMKGLLGEGSGETIFSSDEQKLLENNRVMTRDARLEVLDFCFGVDYEPRRQKK
ncbi:MAG: hypothetical protein JRI68_27600 [Deltaproteobacteria bacterium]|nr:hypothetical protein [Deltaproteobacteria bacterium]